MNSCMFEEDACTVVVYFEIYIVSLLIEVVLSFQDFFSNLHPDSGG